MLVCLSEGVEGFHVRQNSEPLTAVSIHEGAGGYAWFRGLADMLGLLFRLLTIRMRLA